MRKLVLALIFFLAANSAYAEFGRSTTFDDREECVKTKGVWREFGDSAVDSCESKLDKYSIAAQVITYACDCGKGRCWDGETCVAILDYKKIFDQRKAKENKKIAAERKARSDEYRDYSNDRLSKMISGKMGSGGDGSNNSADNNLSQFSDKLPSNNDAQQAINPNNVMNDIAQKVQDVADQTTQNSNTDQSSLGAFGKIFSLPSDTNKAPADNSTANAGPTPFFLQQQENAKKEAEVKASQTATPSTSTTQTTTPAIIPIPALPKEEGLPALPQLPLPQ